MIQLKHTHIQNDGPHDQLPSSFYYKNNISVSCCDRHAICYYGLFDVHTGEWWKWTLPVMLKSQVWNANLSTANAFESVVKAMLVESYTKQKLWIKKSSKHLDSLKSVCLSGISRGGSWFFFCQPKKNRWHFLWGSKPRGVPPPLWQKPPIFGVPFWSSRPCMACKHSSPANLKTRFSAQILRRWVDESIFSHLSITMAYIYIYKYTYIHKVPSWKLTYCIPSKVPENFWVDDFPNFSFLVRYVIDRSLEGI